MSADVSLPEMSMYGFQAHVESSLELAPKEDRIGYLCIALCGETGEFANKIKKIKRGDSEQPSTLALIDELGDILWYVAALAHTLDYDLSSVAYRNISKLQSRRLRDTVQGNGDDR